VHFLAFDLLPSEDNKFCPACGFRLSRGFRVSGFPSASRSVDGRVDDDDPAGFEVSQSAYDS
jgi:hypothetical protein